MLYKSWIHKDREFPKSLCLEYLSKIEMKLGWSDLFFGNPCYLEVLLKVLVNYSKIISLTICFRSGAGRLSSSLPTYGVHYSPFVLFEVYWNWLWPSGSTFTLGTPIKVSNNATSKAYACPFSIMGSWSSERRNWNICLQFQTLISNCVLDIFI